MRNDTFRRRDIERGAYDDIIHRNNPFSNATKYIYLRLPYLAAEKGSFGDFLVVGDSQQCFRVPPPIPVDV